MLISEMRFKPFLFLGIHLFISLFVPGFRVRFLLSVFRSPNKWFVKEANRFSVSLHIGFKVFSTHSFPLQWIEREKRVIKRCALALTLTGVCRFFIHCLNRWRAACTQNVFTAVVPSNSTFSAFNIWKMIIMYLAWLLQSNWYGDSEKGDR